MFRGVTVEIQLLNSLYGEFFVLESKLIGIGCKLVCISDDRVWESSREQHYLCGFR